MPLSRTDPQKENDDTEKDLCVQMDMDCALAVCLVPAMDDGAPASTRMEALLQGSQALRRGLPQDSEDRTLLDAKTTSQQAKKQGATNQVAQHHVHTQV